MQSLRSCWRRVDVRELICLYDAMTELAGQIYAERTYLRGFDYDAPFPKVLDGMPHALLPGQRVSYYDRGNANGTALRETLVAQLHSLHPFIYAGVPAPRPEFHATNSAASAFHSAALERLVLPDRGRGRVSELFVEAIAPDEIEPDAYHKIINDDPHPALDLHGGTTLTTAHLIYSGILTEGVRSQPYAKLAVIRAVELVTAKNAAPRISVRYASGKLAVEAISPDFLSHKLRLQQREARAALRSDSRSSGHIRVGTHRKRSKS